MGTSSKSMCTKRSTLSVVKCSTKYCRGPRLPSRTLCAKCKHRRRKETDPVGYQYDFTKQNAKRRGRPFTLTIPYFRKWCEETDYIKLKGRFKDSMTIDCIIEELGYADYNIQILSNVANIRKRWVKYWADKERAEVPDDYVPPKKEKYVPTITNEVEPW